MSKDYLAACPSRRPLPGRQWLAAVALIACAQLATLALSVGPYPHERGQRLFLGLLACGPILLLRRWPLPVLAAAGASTGLVMAAGNASLPFGVLLGVAMYFAASRLPRRVSIRAAAATAVALVAALAYASLEVRTASPAGEAVEGFLPLAAAWFVGDSVAARRRYLAGLAEQAERERAAEAEQAERERAAEAERARRQVQQERVRIARELHDVVAHTLAVMTVQAGVGRRLAAKRPEEASKALESIELIGRTAHEELRVVLGLLREEEAGAAVLAPTPRLADLSELVENVRASGTPVDLRMSGTDQRLSPALELSIYRVVQEALTNVVKHAPGACASVDLTVSAKDVRIEVADDGGPPAGSATPPGQDGRPAIRGTGHGIVGMRERIGAFGGWLVAEPLAGDGFRVLAEVPVEGTV